MSSRQSKNLSWEEIELLRPCIENLRELELGKRAPTTSLQVHFLDVCKGKVEASTKHAFAYLKWRQNPVDLNQLVMSQATRVELGQGPKEGAREIERKKAERNARNSEKQKREFKKIKREATARTTQDRKASLEGQSYKRFIDEPLESREEFKKDRASWKNSHS